MSLKSIIKEIKERGLTAYEIAKETPLTEAGINKILNGNSKNPHKGTIEILEKYLFHKPNMQDPNDLYLTNKNIAEKLRDITTPELLHMLIVRFDELMDYPTFKILIEREVLKKQVENQH
ncbi:helix-turn-helix transcriptional regulator [Arenibacter sp. BSSL-BM3]|uniref:Helix-turn-helix transcriptional regulator n=1 Tax=Arenibacter arenosicollis TaxID=2762274 RepID=A0ABR7QJ10_9FLAO|nr:helix-turn-helix transcriptional regulator [Arenibacter arenosicollis]MBC8767170.1 helix-turn-helix transcriptional regulator [Arenibacter arenosicollis]